MTPVDGTPGEVVARLGAVQAQDFAGARWAVGQRTPGSSDIDVERACDDGSIVRTHIMRPTWHLVAAVDVRWMLALTAPRVHVATSSACRQLELDHTLFRRSNAALTKALEGGYHLTRAELSRVLARARIDVSDGRRVGHLLMRAELDGVVCSGARRDRQSTYALLDERVPPTPLRHPDEALRELASRYFATRGPATVQDFSWWSGLTIAEARRGVHMLESELEQERVDGRVHWFAGSAPPACSTASMARLLPNYDEYFIGFKDRSAILDLVRAASPGSGVPLTAHVIIIDGQVAGTWMRTLARDSVVVQMSHLTPPRPSKLRAVALAARRYGDFLGLPVRLAH